VLVVQEPQAYLLRGQVATILYFLQLPQQVAAEVEQVLQRQVNRKIRVGPVALAVVVVET
jgi:hypothetical protein